MRINKLNTMDLTSLVLCRFIPLGLTFVSLLSGVILASSGASADVVDEISITVPVSCSFSGTGMNSHNTEIANGTYTPDIGTTTLHAFCNDNEGFAIYAAGYTGNEIGGINSNKLVGTSTSGNAVIESGIATTAGNPDVSNWAMRLTMIQDSGDTTSTNVFTIDSAPNVVNPSQADPSAVSASFSSYHVVPNEYVKVAHKNSATDMTASTGGVKLTTTYATYISKTQPADTYSGQVIYTLVHPASASPVAPDGVIVNYNGNGKTFSGGATENHVTYAINPMYIATTPEIAKSPNVQSDGTQNGGNEAETDAYDTVTVTGASKLKVVLNYDLTTDGLTYLSYTPAAVDNFDDSDEWVEIESESEGTVTILVEGESITFNIYTDEESNDYGFYAQVYPIYNTEQTGTEASDEYTNIVAETGAYATTTDWYGSWYADVNNVHYDFLDEAEVKNFLANNNAVLGGTTIDVYRGLTFTEAYTRANKTQDGGYYKQQELTKAMCNAIAITQNQTLKDVRDNNTYMVGKLKDGNCWMLNNLALDPTDPTTAANMSESNTNATAAAITNLLSGGNAGGNAGWSSAAVVNTNTDFSSYIAPMINNANKNTLITSYGPASTNNQDKVGIHYNFCAASAGTYCHASDQGIDIPDTLIDAPYDICPVGWRMPTGNDGEYSDLIGRYSNYDAADAGSLQYNLSTPFSGFRMGSSGRMGADGHFWSSTFSNELTMEYLSVNTYDARILADFRDYGLSVRCLVGS